MFYSRLSVWWQCLFLLASIIGIYVWFRLPWTNLSLQLFAVLMLFFFVIKKFSPNRTWTILPAVASLEMALMTAALLLLVTATGNLDSPLFVITYIHLFMLVFSVHPLAAIVTTSLLTIFHYTEAIPVNSLELTTLLTIPLGLIFFLYAREQYHELLENRKLVDTTHRQVSKLSQDEQLLESFAKNLLLPRLHQLTQELSQSPSEVAEEVKTITSETQAVIESLHQVSHQDAGQDSHQGSSDEVV